VLELRQLRYFVAVADTGQITEAASRLGIAQPTLSQSLAQLEGQVGVRLFERRPSGVRLTEPGRLFLEKARATVRAADETFETATSFGRSRSGRLAVGYSWRPLTRWAPMFQRLVENHAGAQLDWKPLGFPRAGRLLDGVDVAIFSQPTPDEELSSLVLERDPRMVIMAVTHRLAGRSELRVADVLDETWPGPDPSTDPRWWAFWTLDEERGGPPRVTADRVNGAATGTEVLAAGGAIGTSGASMAAGLTHPGLVAVPLVDAHPVTLALVWRTEHENPLIDELVAIATEMTNGKA
jgi:DNA-binding transcriptional LysR family regulator